MVDRQNTKDEKNVGTKWGIFHQLVDLINKLTTTIMVFLNYFPKSRRDFKFKYVATNNIRIETNSIINLFIMTFDKFQKN
jgi:hypothetical protein